MKPKYVSYDEIDEFVSKQQKLGKDWFWDGWTVNIFTPSHRARTKVNACYRNGKWGFLKKVSPSPRGNWIFDRKYLNSYVK